MLASAERKWLALALLCVVQFMVVLDIAIVNVALPSIQVDLGFSQENLQWVISAYALLFGGFLLLGGRAADLLGRRRLFIGGLVVFSAASLLSGLAWSDDALIVARAFQGLGAAIIPPAALSILMTTFSEGRERNTALGVWGAVGAFGAVAGVLLGGILTDWLSWEWIFYINVPVGLAALALTPLLLTESRDAHVKSFDALGAVLSTSGLITLVYAITQANDYGWSSFETIGLFVAAGVILAGFVVWEARAKEPVIAAGMTFLTAGLLYFTQVSVGGSYLGDLLPGFLLIAVGLGFSFVPISIAALAGVEAAEAGLASGLINTSQQIGGALGIAALSTIATSRTDDAVAGGSALPTALVDGFSGAFLAGVIIAGLGIVAALTLIRRDELEQAPDAQAEPALDLAA